MRLPLLGLITITGRTFHWRTSVRGGGKTLLFGHTKWGRTTGIDLSTICVDEKDLIGSYSADVTLQKGGQSDGWR